MPTYDYVCPTNGETVEVVHRMTETIATWGDLCDVSGRPLGQTPPEAPVRKKISAAAVVTPSIGEWKKKTVGKNTVPRHTHGPGCGCG